MKLIKTIVNTKETTDAITGEKSCIINKSWFVKKDSAEYIRYLSDNGVTWTDNSWQSPSFYTTGAVSGSIGSISTGSISTGSISSYSYNPTTGTVYASSPAYSCSGTYGYVSDSTTSGYGITSIGSVFSNEELESMFIKMMREKKLERIND